MGILDKFIRDELQKNDDHVGETRDEAIMRLYLEHCPPMDRHLLTGEARFWFTNSPECAKALTMGNMSISLQNKIFGILLQCRDLESCANANKLIDDLQLEAYEICLTQKTRSDFIKGIGERIPKSMGTLLPFCNFQKKREKDKFWFTGNSECQRTITIGNLTEEQRVKIMKILRELQDEV